jgi:hypothetical protein
MRKRQTVPEAKRWTNPAPNHALEPTAYSFGSAPLRLRFRRRLTTSVRCGHADHTFPNAVMAWGGWWLRLVSAGHLGSSDTAEHAPSAHLYSVQLQ